MNQRTPERRTRIAAAFDRASDYDDGAVVQRAAAQLLAQRIAAAGLRPAPRVLEIGCGTGFLTRALGPRLDPAARWTVSDIAPAMLDRARATLDLKADFRLIDGEALPPGLEPFDLIAANLVVQWFDDLPGALERLAAQTASDGLLAFSTMAAGSFAEWTAALGAEGLASGTPTYPDAAALEAITPAGLAAEIGIVDFPQRLSAQMFLRQLKTIGASTPAPGYRPLSAAELRRAIARFDAGPQILTYRVAFCLLRN